MLIQNLEYMQMEGQLTIKNIRELEKKILNQIDFMVETMERFRKFSKPSKKQKKFSFNLAVRETYELILPQILRYGIETVFQEDERLEIKGYKNDFMQVVLSILNNARDALLLNNVREPKITIRFLKKDDVYKIEIADNAGGIPEDLLPDRLFESYITTKDDTGTGIGLSLAKAIIEDKMEGSLSVVNQDGGACFTICFNKDP